jgi:hypothetical protein
MIRLECECRMYCYQYNELYRFNRLVMLLITIDAAEITSNLWHFLFLSMHCSTTVIDTISCQNFATDLVKHKSQKVRQQTKEPNAIDVL